MTALDVGTRIRVKEGAPWPERWGCTGVIVAPTNDGVYPQPAKNEVLVHLDSDPLQPQSGVTTRFWTCVMSNKDVEPASEPLHHKGSVQ